MSELVAIPFAAAGPVARVLAEPYVAMEGGPGPIEHAADQVVLHGIHVDVVNTPLQVVFIPAGVLVEPSLPDPTFGFPVSALSDESLVAARLGPEPCEAGFDQTPAAGIIRITRWQFPHRVEMVG